MKSKGSTKKSKVTSFNARTPTYDKYHRYSESSLGKYSRYPGIILIIALLAGFAAGFPSAANSIISFDGYAGFKAGLVWLAFTIMTAGTTMAALVWEKIEDWRMKK